MLMFMVMRFMMVVFMVLVAPMLVIAMSMCVSMHCAVGMSVAVSVIVPMFMLMFVSMLMVVVVIVRKVNVELYTFNARLFPARDVQVVTLKTEFSQLLLQPARINPQVNQRADQHVAA